MILKKKKKYRKKKKKSYRKNKHNVPGKDKPFNLDPRAMEKYLADLQGVKFGTVEEARKHLDKFYGKAGMPRPKKQTALERAQGLVYDAWETTGEARVRLAQKALEISKDCADAYVILAKETARDINDAMQLYEQGIKAGERALGEATFVKDVGYFWGLLETRPYMRARAGFAGCLWSLGKHQQAMEHYQDMLRLNPSDNRGIRYLLINCLLEMELNDDAEKLLNDYDDEDTTFWLYSRALLLFRHEKRTEQAKEVLVQAIKANPFVPPYLLGIKKIPEELPDLIGYGDETEAVAYAADALPVWHKTLYACQWLSDVWYEKKS